MFDIFLASVLTCKNLTTSIERVSENIILTKEQKREVIKTLRESTPECSVP
jgi:hypothetical protein